MHASVIKIIMVNIAIFIKKNLIKNKELKIKKKIMILMYRNIYQ